MAAAVRAAGIRLAEQEHENADALHKATDTAGGYPTVGGARNKNVICYTDDQGPGAGAAGQFPCSAAPEAAGGAVIPWGYGNSQPANPETVMTLAENWMGVSRDLTEVLEAFRAGITAQFSSGEWTGTAAAAIRSGMQTYLDTSAAIAADAFTNAGKVGGWAANVSFTRSRFEELKAQQEMNDFQLRTAPYVPSMVQHHAIAQQKLETDARDHINRHYNPAVTAIATGLHNLPEPTPPVHPGATPGLSTNGGGGSTAGAASGGGLSAATNATGPRSGAAAHTAATRPDTAAHTADTAANTTHTPTAQAGDPASAGAQPASPARPASDHSTPDADATRAAGLTPTPATTPGAGRTTARGGTGAGAGGGTGAGAGGGGLAAGASNGGGALTEPPLTARGAAASTTERPTPTPATAVPTTRATPTAGTPMGGRPGASNDRGTRHTTARYLYSTDNGEEIVGPIDNVTPPVFGGLNLDTTPTPSHTNTSRENTDSTNANA